MTKRFTLPYIRLTCVCLGFASSTAISAPDFETEFLSCYEMEFQVEQLSSADAIDIADCYAGLAEQQINQNTLLQYADSWYVFAAGKGHPYASSLSSHTRALLAD